MGKSPLSPWPIGAPFPGLRLEDRDGASEVSVRLAGTCRRFLHPRVNRGVTMAELWLTIPDGSGGERRWPIPWTTVSTIDLRKAPAGPATLHASFGAPSSVSVGFECDDSPENPKPDDRTP